MKMPQIKADKITLVKIDKLKIKKGNRNKHPQDQIEMLAKHIAATGFRNPLIVSNQSGEIVCGHGRLMAAQLAGLTEIPCIYQDFESPEQEYAYHVADNGLALWAELDFSGINSDLIDLGPDFDVNLLGIKDFRIEASETELPDLNSNEPDCQQVTFILSNEQKDLLDEALEKAKNEEDCTDEINKNSNGNMLAAILKRYVYG